MFLTFTFMRSFIIRNPRTFGFGLGLTGAAAMFLTVPAYHDFIIWSWHQPLMWVLGLPAGIIAARLTD
jgi:hypothetical protein